MKALQVKLQNGKDAESVSAGMPEIAARVIRYVLDHFADDICLDDLAAEAGMTRFNFCRRFQKECGITPMRWLWTFRTLLAGEFIRLDPRWSLTDVAFACGFTSSAHFSRSFKQTFGKTPSQFRRQALTASEGDSADHDIMFSDNSAVVGRVALAALN